MKPDNLDIVPGKKLQYAAWQELFDGVKTMLTNYRDIAMQYSPNNLVFTISLVDGGTLEMIRGLGKNVISSGDLVAQFEATWNDEQIKTHFAARDAIDSITEAAFQEIGRRVRNGGTNEYAMQQWLLEAFGRENLVTDDPPVVAVNANSGNPHYDPRPEGSNRFAKAISFCSTSGARKISPTLCTMTSRGLASWANRLLTACEKYSRSSATRATAE